MLIERIELENFMCYSGENSLEFSEGLNVIIGDNGYGKSKLYDAFYWVLYDKVFVSEKKEFLPTRSVKTALISDKAKRETKEGRVSASVRITFRGTGVRNSHILERRYTATVQDGELVGRNESELTIMTKELSNLNAKIVSDDDKKRQIIEKLLPAPMKDYLWFQGEQVESIIDFNKQDTLAKAINVLSDITKFDNLKELALSLSASANAEYDRELKRLSKDVNSSEKLGKEKDEILARIGVLELDESEFNDNLSRAESKCEELLGKQADAQMIKELRARQVGLQSLLSELNDQLKAEYHGFHRKMFRNKWVLKGTETFHVTFSELYNAYDSARLQKAAEFKAMISAENALVRKLQTRLPIDVPEPIYVQRMLDEEKCLVCDRVAKRDSDAWHKIAELMDREDRNNKLTESKNQTKQNFSDDFRRLYQTGLALTHRIKEIDFDIEETLKNRAAIIGKIKDADRKFKETGEEIERLLSDTSLTGDEAINILNEYVTQTRHATNFAQRLDATRQQIETERRKLDRINVQLNDLVTGDIPKWLVEKRQVLNDFAATATSTRERVFLGLISKLQKFANSLFEEMTRGNKSAKGRIELKRLPNGNFMPEIIDENGETLRGSNTSNLILVKLATIMAIVSSKSTTGQVDYYTLIADAPTSVFGEDYTIGFCKTLSKVYAQSIIMSKEFYKNLRLREELMNSPDIKLGRVYMVSPSISEAERTSRHNLATNIEALN